MAEVALLNYLVSDEFGRASSNSSRLVAKLKSAVQRCELYETHQILRTVYFRFINVKEKVFALEGLLYEGALYLLKQGESVSGQDIATIFLEAASKCLQHYQDDNGDDAAYNIAVLSHQYHKNQNTIHYDVSHKVAQIAIQLPDNELGRQKFVADTLKILTPKLINRDVLHNVLAHEFWDIRDYSASRYHFLYSAGAENAENIANLLIQYQTSSANRSEVDLFITQFILQFLCLQWPVDSLNKSSDKKNQTTMQPKSHSTREKIKKVAELIFLAYTSRHPSLKSDNAPLFSLPLLNFTYFIISVLDSNKDSSTFRMLCDIYQVTWTRDPNFRGYLARIGSVYLGVSDEASRQRQGGLFNNILLSLLEEPDDEEEDDDNNHEGNNFSSCDELD